MNEIALIDRRPSPPAAMSALIPTNIGDAMKLADMMASASLVPQHLQKRPADCLLVIEQATRWGMSPFAVAQATSVIQGKLMFEGKLVAAALNTSGILSVRLDFDYLGVADAREVLVRGTLRGETKPREVRVAFRDARTSNRMWQSQPDQQLAYHGARVWSRRHAPEVMLGVYSPEEFDEAKGSRAAPLAPPTSAHKPARLSPPSPSEPDHEATLAEILRKIAAAQSKPELSDVAAAVKFDVMALPDDLRAQASRARADRDAELSQPARGETLNRVASESHQRPDMTEPPSPSRESPAQRDPEAWIADCERRMAECADVDALRELWECAIAPESEDAFPPDVGEVRKAFERHEARLGDG